MNKKLLMTIGIIAGLFLAGGSIVAYSNNKNNKKEADRMAMANKIESEAMMQDETAAMEQEKMTSESDAMNGENAMSTQGTYVTLADYNKDPSKYADTKKVYFFHASWCPICQGIEKEINADMSRIPAGVTLIKTDFDNSTDLRKKYGVTVQYTFVQFDNDGNEVAQWSASSLSDAVAGIKS